MVTKANKEFHNKTTCLYSLKMSQKCFKLTVIIHNMFCEMTLGRDVPGQCELEEWLHAQLTLHFLVYVAEWLDRHGKRVQVQTHRLLRWLLYAVCCSEISENYRWSTCVNFHSSMSCSVQKYRVQLKTPGQLQTLNYTIESACGHVSVIFKMCLSLTQTIKARPLLLV